MGASCCLLAIWLPIARPPVIPELPPNLVQSRAAHVAPRLVDRWQTGVAVPFRGVAPHAVDVIHPKRGNEEVLQPFNVAVTDIEGFRGVREIGARFAIAE